MFQGFQLMLGLTLCLLLVQPFASFAVEEFKVSKNGKGEQIWFEAEAFDERDSKDVCDSTHYLKVGASAS